MLINVLLNLMQKFEMLNKIGNSLRFLEGNSEVQSVVFCCVSEN